MEIRTILKQYDGNEWYPVYIKTSADMVELSNGKTVEEALAPLGGATTTQEVIDALGVLQAVAAAAAYDPEGSYAVGDYCTYKGKLRKCSTAIPTGETWTEAHWTTTTVAAELAELSSQLSNRLRLPIAIPANADLNNYITPGMYYCDVDATVESVQNCPTTHAFSLFVEIGAASEVVQTLKTWHDGNGYKTTVYVRSKYPEWGAGWQKLATATPPEKQNLTLSPGWKVNVTAVGQAIFFKTQDGVVHVIMNIASSTTVSPGDTIATLPVTFRPEKPIKLPIICKISGQSGLTFGHLDVGSNGTIRIYDAVTGSEVVTEMVVSPFSFPAGN